MKHQNQKNEGREWYVLDPHRRKKRVSENAEPLTEGAQSKTTSVLAALIEQHCHLSLGYYFTE